MKDFLINELKKRPSVYPFLSDPLFSSQVVSFIIKNEIGTYRDQLFDILHDAVTGRQINRHEIRVDIITVNDKIGLSISAEGISQFNLKLAGFRALLNPTLSFGPEQQIKQCVLFPESIAKIAALQHTELVIVRDWAIGDLESFDFEYDPIEERKNAIKNRDAITFAELLEKSQLPFMGTHDIVAHIAGINKDAIAKLAKQAKRVRQVLNNFFVDVAQPNQASLILAFTVGVLLDRLAQPPNYSAQAADIILENLLTAIEEKQFLAEEKSFTYAEEMFPDHYETLMETAFFTKDYNLIKQNTKEATQLFFNEMNSLFS